MDGTEQNAAATNKSYIQGREKKELIKSKNLRTNNTVRHGVSLHIVLLITLTFMSQKLRCIQNLLELTNL
jgi:hypothetical protein